MSAPARSIQLIGVAAGFGAQDRGCADGPAALQTLGALNDLDGPHLRLHEEIIRPNPAAGDNALRAVSDIATRLAGIVSGCLRRGEFPLVIGGDHSCAIGTWSGVRDSMGADRRLGLIWIDAHMDSHTPRTSPSQAIHGMPLACLLGHGESQLTAILSPAPQVRPDDVCLVGVRSFEQGEARLLKNLGVRIFFADEVRERGLATVLADAVSIVSSRTAGFGISLDLDALDPAEEPGVGSPVPNGIRLADMLAGLRTLHGDRRLRAIEIVEYNPHRDRGNATARAIHDLAHSLLDVTPADAA